MKPISLSPSKLSLLRDCPRCFYDAHVLKIPRPRGIFPSLPGGMDIAMKIYADQYRGKLPPFLDGKVPGALMESRQKLSLWQNWRTGLKYQDAALGVTLIGALDDVIVDGDVYIPIDWKTRGSAPKSDGSEYYGTQIDCYELMLSRNGYKTSGSGYLCYLWPKEMFEITGNNEGLNCEFNIKVFKLKADPERAKAVIHEAVTLMRGPRPEVNLMCEYCQFIELKKREYEDAKEVLL